MNSLLNLSERQLLLFDLDGTLVDSAPDLYRAMNLALTELQRPQVTETEIRHWVGQGAPQLCRCVLEHQQSLVDEQQLQQLLQLFLGHYQKNLCVDTVIYDGVLAFLAQCQARNKILACVTNKPYHAAVTLLEQLHLLDKFAMVVGGDSLSQRKPHPAPLQHVMQHFALSSSKVLMIGDSRNDVEAARAAGIDCIVLSYGYNHGEDIHACAPQGVIDNLAELHFGA